MVERDETAADGGDPGRGPLSAGRRFLGLSIAWALLLAAMPGILRPDGLWGLAVLGLGGWGGLVLRQPTPGRGRRAFLAAWLANALGMAGTMAWVVYVVPPGLVYVGFGMGLYVTLGALAMRRLGRRFSPGVSLAVAWVGAEVLRTVLVPPLGLGWFRLGHHLHATPWLLGGARVFGVEGLSFVVAALAGVVCEGLVSRKIGRPTLFLATGSVALCFLAGRVVPVPEVRPGPRLLLVQPSISQEVKQSEDFEGGERRARELTLAGLEEQPAEEPIDLVCWGETMLVDPLVEAGVEAALAAGARVPAWWGGGYRDRVALWRRAEEVFLRRGLLARFPAGVSFLSGAIVIGTEGEEEAGGAGSLVRRNSVVLFDSDGMRGPAASKRFLVPGAETAMGFERYAWARKLAWRAMAYVPDFARAQRTGILHLRTRDGASFRIAAAVCFDNAFPNVFSEPVAAGRVDFHLVVSNEAWYREAFEMDQMLSFSRVAAASTGRSLVRATNSGVSCLVGPDGAELARLRVQGADRSVSGTLAVRVPVPVDPAEHPPYPDLRGALRGGILLLLGILLVVSGRSREPAR